MINTNCGKQCLKLCRGVMCVCVYTTKFLYKYDNLNFIKIKFKNKKKKRRKNLNDSRTLEGKAIEKLSWYVYLTLLSELHIIIKSKKGD